MKRVAKAAVFISTISLALVLFFFSAFAPNTSESRLNSAQVLIGILMLLFAILLPAWKSIHKSAANK